MTAIPLRNQRASTRGTRPRGHLPACGVLPGIIPLRTTRLPSACRLHRQYRHGTAPTSHQGPRDLCGKFPFGAKLEGCLAFLKRRHALVGLRAVSSGVRRERDRHLGLGRPQWPAFDAEPRGSRGPPWPPGCTRGTSRGPDSGHWRSSRGRLCSRPVVRGVSPRYYCFTAA